MLLGLTNQIQAHANQECPGQPPVKPIKKITIKNTAQEDACMLYDKTSKPRKPI